MPETHGTRRFYWHLQHYPKIEGYDVRIPLSERAETTEYEHPYRRGTGRVVRFWPLRWAIVVGRWRTAHEEEENLAAAAGGRQDIASAEEIGQW